jgi:hypothetical protein
VAGGAARPLLCPLLMKHLVVSAAALSSLALSATAAASGAPGASIAAAPPPAAAPPSGDRWADRPLAINLHGFAFGAPAGTFAIELEASPRPWLSLSLGTGSATGGTQVAGMARLRNAVGPLAGGVGAGLSTGPYEEWFVLWEPPARAEDVVWSNAELFAEVRGESGLQVRLYLGYSRQLDPGVCVGDCSEDLLPSAMPYLGSALGYAF